VVWHFGVPAAVAAVLGALVLGKLSDAQPWWTYELGGRACEVTPVKLVVLHRRVTKGVTKTSGQ